MKTYKTLLSIGVLLSSFVLCAQTETPAFPTAEGYGKYASGGRGGKVVEVTNLLDDKTTPIEGSLRWALKQYPESPITIVFKTSGTIDLKGNDLRSNRSNITIAGQTAPGDGICIKNGSVNMGGSRNLIIRHIRSRVGLGPENSFIEGACLNIENGGNWIVDHCSFTWSAEENIGFYDNDLTTVQWCLIGEGLYDAGHGKGRRGYGAVVGGRSSTYHHNLIAHNASRHPRFGATTKNNIVMMLEYINNVHYNWGKSNACYGGDNRQGIRGEFKLNFVNNYYKHGPAYPGSNYTRFISCSYNAAQGGKWGRWHLNGNHIDGTHAENVKNNTNNYNGLDISEYTEKDKTVTIETVKSDYMEVPNPINIETADAAYESVLEGVGAWPKDTIDRRIINETRTGTAASKCSFNSFKATGIVDKPEDSGGYCEYRSYNFVLDSDHDGIPDYWETANNIDPDNPEDRNKLTKAGYTYLEAYLNGIVGELMPDVNYPDPVYYIPASIGSKSVTNVLAYPSADGNQLILTTEIPIYNIAIYNIQGKLLDTQQGNPLQQIEINTLPKGVYLLKLTINSQEYSLKFNR